MGDVELKSLKRGALQAEPETLAAIAIADVPDVLALPDEAGIPAAEAEGAEAEGCGGGVLASGSIPTPIVPVVDPGPSVPCQIEGWTHLKVHFDRWVHSSGRQRAFIACKKHNGDCRRYQFVDNFPSRNHCCAWLMEWAIAADLFPDPEDRESHLQYEGDEEVVDIVRRWHNW